MEKHAYLILAHNSFRLLAQLLDALDDERNDIFVHIDAKARNVPFDTLQCHKASLHFIDRISVNWGGASIIWSELNLLKAALKQGHHGYYHLLSGCDLPLKSQDYIHAYMNEHQGTEYVSFWKLKKCLRSRFIYCPFTEDEKKFPYNIINGLFKLTGKLAGLRRHPEVDYRYGANWFSITEALANYVVSKEEWIREVFGHNVNCDEIFLQTLVWNSAFRNACLIPEERDSREVNMANLRLVDWTRGESSSHPWVFTDSDYELLTGTPHLFARKFKEGSGIVDKITEYIKKTE